MVEDRELMLLLVTTTTTAVAWTQSHRVRAVPRHQLLLTALTALNLGYAATIAEGFLGQTGANICNHIEHASYAAHTLLLATWCWVHRRAPREAERR